MWLTKKEKKKCVCTYKDTPKDLLLHTLEVIDSIQISIDLLECKVECLKKMINGK